MRPEPLGCFFGARMKSLWPWLCALLSGALLALAFPPVDWGGVTWVALTPLTCALWFSEGWRKAGWLRHLLLGYLTGLVYFLGSFHWLYNVTGPGWFVLCLYLAIYPALWALFVGSIGRPRPVEGDVRATWCRSLENLRVALTGAAVWTAGEWLRGIVFSGFGWNGLGISLHDNFALMQISDITGVGGLSFLLVMVNLTIVLTVKRLTLEVGRHKMRPHYDFSLTVALVAIVFAYGVRQFYAPAVPSETMTIAAVQGNVPIIEKRDPEHEERILALHTDLSEKALLLNPDLLIWPEAATPRAVFSSQRDWDTVRAIAEKAPGDFLLGTVHFSKEGDFNSAALLTNQGKDAQIYNKIHLVPFGEYVPLRNSFPVFAWIVGDLVPEDFDFGTQPKVLEMKKKPVKLAALICFEDTLGDLARKFVLEGAQLFVNVTNDGWFLHSAGSLQHLRQAVFRCAETKIPMVRAANTGISCVIDRFGRVQQKLADANGNTFIEGLFVAPVQYPTAPGLTFYTRYGEVFSMACLGVSVVAVGLGIRRRR